MPELALIHCRQLVTLAGPAGPRTGPAMRDVAAIQDGAMLVRDGRVVAVGSTDEIGKRIGPDTRVLDATGKVALPGFVDAHTHPVFAGNRVDEYALRAGGATYADIAAAGGGIRSTVAKTRLATEPQLGEIAKLRAKAFLSFGTTTIEAKSGYGLSHEEELKILRVIRLIGEQTPLRVHPTYLGAHAFPQEQTRDSCIEDIVERTLPLVAKEGLAKWCDIFVEQNYYTPDEARRILGRAKSLGLGLRMHVDQLRNGGGAALAAELGAKTADHLEQTPISSFDDLVAGNVMPVLLPGSVFCLGLAHYPDGRGMVDAGLPVVIATDFNPGSSPTVSMPFVLSLACTQLKMTPEEALTAATINAACSLDAAGDVGSLELGKLADFTLWDLDDWREIPYWAASVRPSAVYVGGNLVI
jgi:imidazolonepropionase